MANTPKETKLDKDVTKPSTTAPGDGPADTTDPNERASSVAPQPGDEALKVGTVNAVQPMPQDSDDSASSSKDHRIEKYEAVRPNGDKVTVTHNLDTGETKVS